MKLRSQILAGIFGFAAGPAIAAAAYYTPTADIATMVAYGRQSNIMAHVTVLNTQGRGDSFDWKTGTPYSGNCDGSSGGKLGGDNGTVFCASNGSGGFITSGYWQRQFSGFLTTLMFGSDPEHVQDSTAAFNATWAAAQALGYNIQDPVGRFLLTDTVTMAPGVTYFGVTIAFPRPDSGIGTVLDFGTIDPGKPCLQYQAANGTSTIIGPSLRGGGSLLCNGTYAFQVNSIAGGFCEDGSCQNYLFQVHLANWFVTGGSTAGVQIVKCFECSATDMWVDNSAYPQGHGIDFEGSDFCHINGGRYFNSGGYAIKIQAQGTLGNGCVVDGAVDIGHFSATFPAVYLNGRTDVLTGVSIEGSSLQPLIEVGPDGYAHKIVNNFAASNFTANWLKVDNCAWGNLTVTSNAFSIAVPSPPLFPASCPLWYNNTALRRILYTDNTGQNLGNLPFNFTDTDANINGFQWYIAPSNAKSLVFSSFCGNIAEASGSAFLFGACGPGNPYFFNSGASDNGLMTGSITTTIQAWCTSGAGTLTIRADDGLGNTVQTGTLNLTPARTTFPDAFGGAGTYTTGIIYLIQPGTCPLADTRMAYVGANAN